MNVTISVATEETETEPDIVKPVKTVQLKLDRPLLTGLMTTLGLMFGQDARKLGQQDIETHVQL